MIEPRAGVWIETTCGKVCLPLELQHGTVWGWFVVMSTGEIEGLSVDDDGMIEGREIDPTDTQLALSTAWNAFTTEAARLRRRRIALDPLTMYKGEGDA